MDLPPVTPSRRIGRGSKLTPSTTPFLTPSKTQSRIGGGTLQSNGGRSRLTQASPITTARGGRKPYSRYDQSPSKATTTATPYYTPSSMNTPSKQDDDRFIPSRQNLNMELCRRALLTGQKRPANDDDAQDPQQQPQDRPAEETPLQKEFKRRMLSSMCNIPLDRLDEDGQPMGLLSFGAGDSSRSLNSFSSTSSSSNENRAPPIVNPFSHDTLRKMKVGQDDFDAAARLSVAKKVLRKVPSAPIRILDAPDIVDDYYLNLISWGKDNILAVALAQSVYLWNASTGDIQHLITVEQANDYITSVCWCPLPGQTKYIAVGTNTAKVHLFDGHCLRKVRTLTGHTARVSALTWNQHNMTSGARDSLVINHDVRQSNAIVNRFVGHHQEVCGLKWNEDGTTLASGGNENFLCLWDAHMSADSARHSRRSSLSGNDFAPRLVLKQHKAAVKALDWCPFHRGLLASGGGTADRTIKFWNSSSGAVMNSIDTGSQVCSIVWNKHQRELCSSHGYSENQLILWKYPTMTKIKELTGHTARVLNMEMSPDGTSVVSAAADETLRFWNVFGNPNNLSNNPASWAGDVTFGGPCIR